MTIPSSSAALPASTKDDGTVQGEAVLPRLGRRWLVTAPALLLPLLVCFVYFVWMPGTVLAKVAYSGIKVWLLVWPIAAGLWILRERHAAGLRMNWLTRILPPPAAGAKAGRSTGQSMLIGAGFGIATAAFAALLLAIPGVGQVLRDSGPQIREQVTAFGVMEHYFLFGIFIAVIHSVLEEFYWRGFVFGHLRRLMPLPLAHLLAALGFAAHHVVVLNQFFPLGAAWAFGGAVAIGGLVWSLLYQRHGTLAGAWISHLIVDVVILVIGWRLMHG